MTQKTAIQPTRIRQGIIGPQLEKTGPNAGKVYPGGNHQYEFVEGKFDDSNPYTKFLKRVNEKQLK